MAAAQPQLPGYFAAVSPSSGGAVQPAAASQGLPKGFSLDREFELASLPSDSRKIKVEADAFALLKTVEAVEDSYSSGIISEADYERVCRDLIKQFTLKEKQLHDATGLSPKEFVAERQIRLLLGVKRLVHEKVPATMLMQSGTSHSAGAAALEAGTAFVTALDAIDMGHKTKEDLWGPVSTIVSVLNRIPSLPSSFEAMDTMRRWFLTLQGLALDESLDADQIRQLRFDIDASYTALRDHLMAGGST